MQYAFLGRTGIKVSRLCFGTLTLGPAGVKLSLKEGAALLQRAWEEGINFFDTAESYANYPYLRRAFSQKEVVIATKSYAYTAKGMAQSLKKAQKELGREAIDLFLLHEQESALTLKGHAQALAYLCRAKERGWVRAVGISTHYVGAVKAAAKMPEIDIIHPLINFRGIGIQGGDLPALEAALAYAHTEGKGIYAMKPLGGGHLASQAAEALNYVFGLPFLDAVAVGMQSEVELAFNLALAEGKAPKPELASLLALKKRHLLIEPWCEGCGRCAERCPQGALTVKNRKAEVTPARCIFCGYCAMACPHFCLKII